MGNVAGIAPAARPGVGRPDLATGILEIDRQHAELIANVSRLREAARTGDVGLAEGVLLYLERYAAEHFATEERAMWESGFAGLDDHWSLHLAFATELAERKAEHTRNPGTFRLLVEMSHWMDRWLEQHVLGADSEMARFLRERGHPAAAYQ